jgi:predicted dehydrogenase
MLGGGSLLDLGCYGIDFVHRFLKEKISVIEVKATPVTGEQRLWSSHPDYPVDSKASLIAQTPSGVKVLITTSFLDEARQSIIITAKNGIKYELPQAFRVGATASRILIHYPDGLISSHEFSTCDSDLEIIRTFAENVFKGESLGQEQTRRLRFTAEVLEKAQKFIYNNELFR